MATEKIVSPRTHKAYRIRQRTTKNGNKGQIMGSWSPKDCKHKK
jgi:hypothetical protein